MNSWPDAAMTPFRNEKNSNWEGAYRVPAMFRWPGKIKPGQVSNEMVAHHDLLPTLVAMAGDPDIKDKLLKGHKVGDMTYKVHLDGFNFVPHLTDKRKRPGGIVPVLSTMTSNWTGFVTTTGSSRSWNSAPQERCESGRNPSPRCGCRRSSI